MSAQASGGSPLLQLPPLSLYVHIPWCVRKCPYCDFNSHAGDDIPETQYVAALLRDLEEELPAVQGRRLQSIFFGGGTPSLFSPQSIENILAAAQRHIGFSDNIEITLEANPGTVEQAKFAGYRSAGVNRLSIGVQSFQQGQLQALGRIHSSDEAIAAARAAVAAGLDNFNLDLMHGLPGQTPQQAKADLLQAIDLGPSHISWYQLTIEPNTAFFSQPPPLPDEDHLADIQTLGEQTLSDEGYRQYEISAFARATRQSRHNLNYWTFGDYIGIGAGAHGKSTDINKPSIQRRWKQRQPAVYLEHAARGKPCSGSSELDQSDLLFEFLLNALRLRQGFSYESFEQRTGIDKQRLLEACKNTDPDLLVVTDTGINTSKRGFDFLNDVLESFLVNKK